MPQRPNILMTSHMPVLFYAQVHAKRVKKPLVQGCASSYSKTLYPLSKHLQILIRCRVRHLAECTLQVRIMKDSGLIRRDLPMIFVTLALKLHLCRKEHRHMSLARDNRYLYLYGNLQMHVIISFCDNYNYTVHCIPYRAHNGWSVNQLWLCGT